VKYGQHVYDYGRTRIDYLDTVWGRGIKLPAPPCQKRHTYVMTMKTRNMLRQGLKRIVKIPKLAQRRRIKGKARGAGLGEQ